MSAFGNDVVVVGGCGHVGLPLAIAFAGAGLTSVAYDIDSSKVDLVNSGALPFKEDGALPVLQSTLSSGHFRASAEPADISQAENVVVVVGTPVDEYLTPDPEAIIRVLAALKPYLRGDQLIVLRSTVFPGVTKRVEEWLSTNVPGIKVTFCPERIAEGKAMTELYSLPQIIGSRDEVSARAAEKLFGSLGNGFVHVSPEEAELAKLFTNVWRYIKFAAVNQFFMMANDFGVDFERVRGAITQDYPRASDMPAAGFAAGPCLFKDTMQLSAFSSNTFALGHAAMLINEGLPLYVVDRMDARFNLADKVVGILGMAFKPEVDDPRSSLSYKLRKQLLFRTKDVLISDPYVQDERLVDADELIRRSDIVVIGTPHSEYRSMSISKPVVDVWNMSNAGVLL